jgi:hypothetical protein
LKAKRKLAIKVALDNVSSGALDGKREAMKTSQKQLGA